MYTMSADKSGIQFFFFLIISNNVTLSGSLKYPRLIKGFFPGQVAESS